MSRKRVGTRIRYLLIAMIGATVYLSANATTTQVKRDRDQDYYDQIDRKWGYYRQRYSNEIFIYCIYRGDVLSIKVRRCMKAHEKLKNSILGEAQLQLGKRTLAQSVYNGCVDYYPKNGVARISACVRTWLMLRSKLEDESVEKIIYQKCDSKWRKHGFRAVHNCSLHEGSYYLENGQLRDR
jgi:hypothetical protein